MDCWPSVSSNVHFDLWDPVADINSFKHFESVGRQTWLQHKEHGNDRDSRPSSELLRLSEQYSVDHDGYESIGLFSSFFGTNLSRMLSCLYSCMFECNSNNLLIKHIFRFLISLNLKLISQILLELININIIWVNVCIMWSTRILHLRITGLKIQNIDIQNYID